MEEVSAMTPVIETRNVTKTFVTDGGKTFQALAGIDLAIREKEFVCVLGPSGCGKSTWLRIVAGLEKPTSGAVQFRGRDITGPSRERGMVFQEYSLFPWRSVLENVA